MMLLLSNVALAANSIPDLYNITKKKAYTNPTNQEIKSIISEVNNGDIFAKKIGGKLVNFNDYYSKLVEEYGKLVETGYSDDQIIEKLVESIPGILQTLPETVIDEPVLQFYVLDIY